MLHIHTRSARTTISILDVRGHGISFTFALRKPLRQPLKPLSDGLPSCLLALAQEIAMELSPGHYDRPAEEIVHQVNADFATADQDPDAFPSRRHRIHEVEIFAKAALDLLLRQTVGQSIDEHESLRKFRRLKCVQQFHRRLSVSLAAVSARLVDGEPHTDDDRHRLDCLKQSFSVHWSSLSRPTSPLFAFYICATRSRPLRHHPRTIGGRRDGFSVRSAPRGEAEEC